MGTLGTELGTGGEHAMMDISNLHVVQTSRPGDMVAVLRRAAGAVLSIVNPSGQFSVNGDRLEAGATPLTLGPVDVTIRQTVGGVAVRDQVFPMVVVPAQSGNVLNRVAQLGALSFQDAFTSYPDIYHPTLNPTGAYATFYNLGGGGVEADQWASASSRTLSYANGSGNNEAETYVDPVYAPGLDPFTLIAGGGLKITASATPPALLPAYSSRPVVSGLLRTRNFTPTYGYHEVRWLNENKPGYWSAAWLYPKVVVSNAEIDTQESGPIFSQPAGNVVFQTTHAPVGGFGTATFLAVRPDQAFRTAGVLWKADSISYYLDGIETVAPFARPAGLSAAMCLLINLAVGWFNDGPAGPYDPAQLPYRYYVDYQRFYAIAPGAPSLLP